MRKRTIVAGTVGVAVGVIVIVGVSSGGGGSTAHQQHVPAAKSAAGYSVAQKQAIGSAKNYIDVGAFSRAGLMHQLTSKYGEGFSKSDAEFAVDHVKVSWNKEAVQAAENYLSTGNFSRAGLINQLTSQYGDRFTHAQAVYAVDHVGL